MAETIGIKIKLFGMLTELIGKDQIEVNQMKDTDTLLEWLKHHYPSLREQRLLISVNRQLIHENTLLNKNTEVALLPPFSGG